MRFASGSIMSTVVTAVCAIAGGEAYAAYAALVEAFQLGVRHRRVDDAHAARVRDPELPDGVDRHAVVGGVVPRLDDDDAREAQALLQQPVIRDRRVRRPLHGGLKARIVDMDVAVGRSRRRLELRRVGAGRVRALSSSFKDLPESSDGTRLESAQMPGRPPIRSRDRRWKLRGFDRHCQRTTGPAARNDAHLSSH